MNLIKEMPQMNNMPAPTSDEMLNYLSESGIIDISDVLRLTAEMNLEKQIASIHSHKIWQGNDKRWYTYIHDEQAPKKRKLISRKDKLKLLELLAKSEPEKCAEHMGEVTLKTLYPQWIEHKALFTESTTITRINSDWKKYYCNDPIIDFPMRLLNKLQLESWVMNLIRKHEMTKTNYYNVSSIMRQMFEFAYESNLIPDNTFDRVKKNLSRFFKRSAKPEDETQVYTDEEIKCIEKSILSDVEIPGRKIYQLAPLAILFQLYTGVRVSEVCALKYSDISADGMVKIQRMVVRDTGEVRDRTKGACGHRQIYLPRKARNIVDMTLQLKGDTSSEYVFSRTDIPIPERAINTYLKRYCENLGIPYRSSHKLRKTAISSMVNNGISLNAVKTYAGHTDESTTLRHYTFDRECEKVRHEQFEKALSYGA